MANPFIHWIEAKGPYAPWLFLAVFLAASFLMLWRLEVLSAKGFEGTVLGTLVMPYCTGMGNLLFAFILGRTGGSGADVMTNSLVNNITNMTLVLGLPSIFWAEGSAVEGQSRTGKSRREKTGAAGKTQQLNRLSLLLTLTAVLFFTGAVWAMGRKGRIDFNDGLVLVGLFLFWQCFHVFEVLKSNVRQGKSLELDAAVRSGAAGRRRLWDLRQHGLAGGLDFAHPHRIISAKYLGWLSGWLMVLPNAMLAVYYSWRGQPETVYASQVGDSHVSIPLCLGVYALYHTMAMPPFFHRPCSSCWGRRWCIFSSWRSWDGFRGSWA